MGFLLLNASPEALDAADPPRWREAIHRLRRPHVPLTTGRRAHIFVAAMGVSSNSIETACGADVTVAPAAGCCTFGNTFGGYSASRANPQWVVMVERDITTLVDRLLQAGLAEREGDLIHLTLLGRACGSSSLSFESSLRLVELMGHLNVAQTPPSHILAMVQVLDELDAIYTPVMKKGQSESVRAGEAAQRFGHQMPQMLQRYCRDQIEFWARCKRAALLHDWIEGTPVDVLEKRYSTTPFGGAIGYGNIIGIADATRFHLRSAHQILATLFPDQPDYLKSLDEILQRLEFGLPSAALPLTKVSVRLTRGQCLELLSIGVRNEDALNNLDEDRLRRCVGAGTATLLAR